MYIKTLLLCLGFYLFGSGFLFGAHIIGGDVVYNCLGTSVENGVNMVEFEIIFTMYRDCQGGGGDFDNPANFGLFRGSDNNWTFVEEYSEFVGQVELVPLQTNPCIDAPSNVCLQKGSYLFTIKVPIINENYIIAYQRCCRNNSILNIVNPGDTGAAFTVEITPLAQQLCNNSPKFNEFPPPLICANTPISIDQGATDVEGNQIVYEFCAPLESGGTDGTFGNPGDPNGCTGVIPDPSICSPPFGEVIFKLPNFTPKKPLGDGVFINTINGFITGSPTIIGQFVVGVCVKEYDNGQLLSIIRRDFQFNVTTCEVLLQADISLGELQADNSLYLSQCGDSLLTIINNSEDASLIEEYFWEFYLPNNEKLNFDTRDVDVPFPGIGNYAGLMILNPGAIGCIDSVRLEVDIFPSIEADFDYEYDTCSTDPVRFEDLSVAESGFIKQWDWLFESAFDQHDQNVNHSFLTPGKKEIQLVVTDINDCRDTLVNEIEYFPAPSVIVVEPSTFEACPPFEILFNNLSTPIDSTYIIEWDFGDGNTSTEISPRHTFEDVGIYSLSLFVESPLGCTASKQYPYWIEMLPFPAADFSYSPSLLTGDDAIVEITDESDDAISWQYIIDNEFSIFQPNPTYQFDTVGFHTIELIVTHPDGCTDRILKEIYIEPVSKFFLPNAFSPNGDGKNDLFRAKGKFENIEDFQILVWNRWGEKVFESSKTNFTWDGNSIETGKPLMTGVYYYQYQLSVINGESRSEQGQINIIR